MNLLFNKVHTFPTPRMVASKTNEDLRLQTLPRNKSLTLRMDLVTENENVSPVLDVQNSSLFLEEIRLIIQLRITYLILEVMN